MKLLIQNKLDKKLQFRCRTCNKTYEVGYDELTNIPLWKFESCSKLCAMSCSDNKLVTLNKKTSN